MASPLWNAINFGAFIADFVPSVSAMITSIVLQVAVPQAIALIFPEVDAAPVYEDSDRTKQSALQKGGKLVSHYIEKRDQAHDGKRARNNRRNQAKKAGKGEKRARKERAER
ncbi:hypothetical protein OEA41_005447 [Lepraria neglecta]|uniref:Uncharacterized protein n=1 Tax=Lepraria neglecta TaxID=209136 RepID=A0AAE0DGS8_9LECA|nr:hypothetical protein OEA41_005447 [Lepraria neglecta]